MATTGPTDVDDTGDPALGEAAMRLALGFSRPSIVGLHVALLVGALDFLWVGLGYWFVLYASTTVFSAWHGAVLSFSLAGVGVATLAAARRYPLSCLIGFRHAVFNAAIAAGVPLVLLQVSHLPYTDAAAASRATLLLWGGVGVPLRWMIGQAVAWAADSGLTARRAIIAGGGDEAIRVLRGVAQRQPKDLRICAFFDDRGPDRVPERVLEVPKIGRFDDLVAFCRVADIDLIIITLPLSARARIAEIMDKLKVLPVAVHLSRASKDLSFPDARGVGLWPSTFHARRRLTKRAFDLLVGLAALVLLAPLMIAAAVAVKANSPGPVFFRQKRHGFNNRVVRIWKFRSMYTEACDPDGNHVVSRGDSRVTPVGRVLRKTSIDELPQLFNVLQGSLSLVGPRPHALKARSAQQEPFEQLVRDYSARHRLPPGITGLAQIHGFRGEIQDREQLRRRVADDLNYIENWSLWLDIYILLRTPFALFNTRNAY